MTNLNSTPDAWLDTPLARRFPWTVETLLVIVLIAFAFGSRFYDLGARVMSHDEVNHVGPSFDFYQGHGYRYDPISHGPLQFHLIALSYFLLGDSDFTSRVPAALFSVASVIFALLAFRRYLGRWGALAAGLLLLISPYMLFYGRYARNEAFIVFWGIVTLYAILRYLERGEAWVLVLFTLINALHFTDKATAYIFAAEQLLFLAGYFTWRSLRRPWAAPLFRPRFLLAVGASLIFAAATASLYLLVKPLNLLLFVPLALFTAAGAVAVVTLLVRGVGWAAIRAERSLDLLILLTTLVLPLLAALPVSLTGANPTDYSPTGLLRSMAVILPLALIAIGLGLWWNRRAWPIHAAVFYAPFVVLYTTIFTNPVGLAGGFMGALGYWMQQQGVDRGSQPWYYYLLLQIPVYEFLPAVGLLVAVFIGWRRRLWQVPAGQTFVPAPVDQDRLDPVQPVPTLALLVYWSASSLVAFTVAGEKMPWLTIHITLPFILASGWAIGYLIETTRWAAVRQGRPWLALLFLAVFVPALGGLIGALSTLFGPAPGDGFAIAENVAILIVSSAAVVISGWGLFNVFRAWVAQQSLRQMGRLTGLVFLAVLACLTARTAYRAAYVNYDYPLEYMVYAHGAPAPKRLAQDITNLSLRLTDGLNMVVAYDNFVRYPYWWYMRHFPNRIDFDVNPTNDVRRAAVILVGSENQAKMMSIVRSDYVEFDYIRMWWPNQDYWRLKWDEIDGERRAQLTNQGVKGPIPPMGLGEYLRRAWGHIQPFFTDARVRSAIIQIWVNRDYTQYAAFQNDQSFSLANWNPSDRMHVYVRKDLAALMTSTGAVNTTETSDQSDPYRNITAVFNPDVTFGDTGNQPGQFQAPRSVAVGPDGSLYVADSRNHRIQHFDARGASLQIWGSFADQSQGAAPGGTFMEPWGVAVGPDGFVYVADTWNQRVQKFSSDGKFLQMWSSWTQAGQVQAFWGPRAIAAGADGRVFVADTGNKRVVVFDSNGAFITQFGGGGQDPGQMDEPVGLAVDSQGRVYVADTWHQRVQVFAPDASGLNYALATSWKVAGWYGQSVDNKPYLAVDGKGDVFVTDPEACRVIEYAPTGQPTHLVSKCSSGADGFGQPSGVAVDQAGGLWVGDAANARIFHFPSP